MRFPFQDPGASRVRKLYKPHWQISNELGRGSADERPRANRHLPPGPCRARRSSHDSQTNFGPSFVLMPCCWQASSITAKQPPVIRSINMPALSSATRRGVVALRKRRATNSQVHSMATTTGYWLEDRKGPVTPGARLGEWFSWRILRGTSRQE